MSGSVLLTRRLIQFGGFLAIAAFSGVLPLAQAADEERGETWPEPMRIGCVCLGLLALPWPLVTFVVATAAHQPGALLIAVFPALIVADLFRSAFVRAHPTDGHRRLLKFKPSTLRVRRA